MDLNLDLGPHEKRHINLTDYFGVADGELARSILKISGELSIAGYYSYSPADGGDRASYPLMDTDDLGDQLSLGHYAGRGGYFWTSLCVFNPGETAIEIEIEPFDADGELMASDIQSIELAPGEYDVFKIRSRFAPQTAAQLSFIKMVANSGRKIGGFFLYGNMKNGITGTDMLSGAHLMPVQ